MRATHLFLIFMGILALGGPSFAAPENTCRASQWPFSREIGKTQSKEDFHRLLLKQDRQAIRQFLYGELTVQHSPSLAQPLLTYLIQTEVDEDWRGFYKTLRWAADLDAATATQPRQLKMIEICDLEQKLKKGGKK